MKLERDFKQDWTAGKRPLFWLGLVLLLGAVLFPYGLLTNYSPGFRFVVNMLFSSEAAHVVGHFFLFLLTGTAVLQLLPRRWWLYFPLMLLLGLGQEWLQLTTFKLRPFAWAEVWDLTVDMLGAATAFWLTARVTLSSAKPAKPTSRATRTWSLPPISRRHVLLLLALVFASVLSLALLAFRIIYTGHGAFFFLAWNLFLAWIPLALGVVIWLRPRGAGAVLACGLWLLFFPNALYLVTDLMHLSWATAVPAWFDAIMLFAFALTGWLLGLVSLHLVQMAVRRHVGPWLTWGFILSALALSGFGVYIGRFLRWNSWDALLRPTAVFWDVALQFFSLSSLAQMVGVTAVLSSLYLLSYLILITLPAVATEPAIVEKEPQS